MTAMGRVAARGALAGLILGLRCCPALGFVGPAQLRGADTSTFGSSRTQLRAPAPTIVLSADDETTGLSAWWPVAGLTLAGALLGQRRRHQRQESVVPRRNGHFRWMYGGDGPPKAPEWLTKPREPGQKSVGNREVPAWFTLQKWEELAAPDRARSMRYWLQMHDKDGNLAYNKESSYTIKEAVDIICGMEERAPCKRDPTMECMMLMNLDQKYPDQQVRCSIKLPHGTGKKVRVAVFCNVDEEEQVMALGAHKCGKVLEKEIQEEVIDFDVLIAKPQMMPRLAKLGKILGPKRLMPSPKSGTVCKDYATAIQDFQGGVMELRTSRKSLINTVFGKVSMGRQQLEENLRALLQGLADQRPAGATEQYWSKIFIKGSMTPSVRVDLSDTPKIIIVTDD